MKLKGSECTSGKAGKGNIEISIRYKHAHQKTQLLIEKMTS